MTLKTKKMEHISNQLAKVEVNQELARQESRPLETTEKQFVSAIEGQKIKDSPLEDLKQVLRLIYVKVGLRGANFPAGKEKDVLHNHIITNYGGHTAKEILLAFEMGMAGKLENIDGDVLDMTTYENFSCLYFSTVMNAYRELAKQTYRQTVKEVPKIEAPKEDLSDKAMQDWYDSTAADYKAGKINSMEFLPPMLADWLIGKGEIDHAQFFKQAAIMIGKKLGAESDTDKEVRAKYHEFKAQYEQAVKEGKPFTGQWATQVERQAKLIALNNYILQEIEL